MGRPLRDLAPGQVHHAWNRGNRRQVVFHKQADYQAFIRILLEAREQFAVKLIAFCLMNNHWHLVVWPALDASISEYMHWVTSTHVHRYQEHYGIVGSGHVYQRRFKNRPCRDERGVLGLIRYVEANPLKAGLVQRAEDWRWSSLWLRAHGDPEGLLAPCPLELPANWADYINQTTEFPVSADKAQSADRLRRRRA